MSESSSPVICFYCDSLDSNTYSFPWLYNPKAKDVDVNQPRFAVFTINLCNKCHQEIKTKAGGENIIVRGWTWWDAAVDYLLERYILG